MTWLGDEAAWLIVIEVGSVIYAARREVRD